MNEQWNEVNEKIKESLKERLTYTVVCEQMPEPRVYHDTYNEALEWAKSNQPAYRPWYIVERAETFNVCGTVEAESEDKHESI